MRLLLLTTIALVVTQQGCALPQDAANDVAVVEGPNPAYCLTADGFFPDPIRCDIYYECVDSVPTEKLCPDGQAFKDDNHKREVCEYLFNVKCEGLRTELQEAQVSPNCPRANGYFAHPDPTNCQEFYYCVNGEPAANTCPAGLHFSKNSGNCGWVAQAGRSGCRKEVSANGFECPVVNDRLRAVSHPRYPNPDDCKLFYVCFNAQGPARDSGCDLGLVFDTELEACHPPSEVVGCENYYDGYFADYWSNLFGAPADDSHIQIAGFLGYDIPAFARKKPNVAQHKTQTQRRRPVPTSAPAQVLRTGAQASRIPAGDTPVAAEPHRFDTESTRPSRPQAASDTPKRRRPGVKRRRKTTTTTTTTTAAPVEPEYYDYEGDYNYYYDDNSTLPIEGDAAVEVPSTTTTTTTTTTPAPTTRAAGPATRRRIPGILSSRTRPVRPSRSGSRPQPEDVVEV